MTTHPIRTYVRRKIRGAAHLVLRRVVRPWLTLPLRRSLVRPIPVAMVTGTKGKTTTTRMLAHILGHAGHVVGFTSTDGISIAGRFVTEQDSSGYCGAARVLKSPEVTAAVLETARGDLLWNGPYLDRCDVAVLLNLGREQIGIDGVGTVDQMARVKRKVIDAARKRVVLNADDPICQRLIPEFPPDRTAVFSFDLVSGPVQEHLRKGGVAYCLEEGIEPRILRLEGRDASPVVRVSRLPAARGGLLSHNVANAMAAAALAEGLGITAEAVSAALANFDCSPEQLPGRFNVLRDDPFLLVLDQAMSPPAVAALIDSIDRIEASGARTCMMTSAGNRAPWHFREMAAILSTAFDRFICYEIERYRRGRVRGEIAGLLRSGLLEAGVDPNSIEIAPDHLAAFRDLVSRARPGDLLMVLGSFKRAESLELARLSEECAGPG